MFKRTFLPCFTLKRLKVSLTDYASQYANHRETSTRPTTEALSNLLYSTAVSCSFSTIWSTSLDVGSVVYNFSSWPRLPHKFMLVWLSSKSFFYHLGAGGNFKNWRFNFLLSQYDSILGIHRERNMLQCKKRTTPKKNRLWFCLIA